MDILVTGGTGHLGQDLVASLKPNHRVRVLARAPGQDPDVTWAAGDLATGAGVAEAVRGAQVVVHAATLSPIARRGYPLPVDLRHSPPEVDVNATRRLLELGDREGVEHFVYVSIVGADHPRGRYMWLKHTAEELVRVGNVPWSILRATPFHWLTDRMLGNAARLPAIPVATTLNLQPLDTRDCARWIAGHIHQGPVQRSENFGGPEVLSLQTLVAQWQLARGTTRRTFSMPVPGRLARAATEMTAREGPRGTITWTEWLAAHPTR